MKALFDVLSGISISPAELILLLLVGLSVVVAFRSQAQADFDWAEIIRDDTGKLSAYRLAVIISLVVSSWVLIYLTMHAVHDNEDIDSLFNWFALYLGVWSGSKIIDRLFDLLLAKYAGIKPPAPPVAAPGAGLAP